MTGIIIALLILIVLLLFSFSRIYDELKDGVLCDCTGDCSNCTIQCQSNPKYYGTKQYHPIRKLSSQAAVRKKMNLAGRILRKARDIFDLICYWIFNIFGIIWIGCILFHLGQLLVGWIGG